MKNINLFFNALKSDSGAVWIENDTIQFEAPLKFQNQETYDFIKENKNEIKCILKENNVYSIRKFLGTTIFKVKDSAFYPLSPAQERLWFIEQYEQGTNAYHMPQVLEFEPTTDFDGIKYALRQIVARHEVLRSTIEQPENLDYAVQLVHSAPLVISEISIMDNGSFESIIRDDINLPFDLSSEYPFRVKFYHIYSVSDTEEPMLKKTVLLVNMHHIASDGWSVDIFQKELGAFYFAWVKGDKQFRFPELDIQYKDYALWQKNYLTSDILLKQLNYWKEKLTGFQSLSFPADFVRPLKIDYRGASLNFRIDKGTSYLLRTIARNHGTTLHIVLLSGLNILLGKYTGQDDIITGSPIANRHHRQTEELIGFFVNTQANRTRLSKNQNFDELIDLVHREQIEAQDHQDLPFEKLVDELGVERDTSRHPVFQVMFGVQNFGNQENGAVQLNNQNQPVQTEGFFEIEKFDFSIFINDKSEEFAGNISYATSIYRKDTIERLIRHFIYLLKQLSVNRHKPYSQISLLGPDEFNQIIHTWNDTDKYYPNNKTINQVFIEQVDRTPDNIALVYDGKQLTYRELNEKSNQLARLIRDQYIVCTGLEMKEDTLIALYLERSLEMVIGILGVLKAGGAYVPVDISYPAERADYIFKDSGAALILTQRLGSEIPIWLPEGKILNIDLSEEFYTTADKADLPSYSKSADLAYVIYTSGTTGKPKGVMITHTGVVNRLVWMQSMYHLTEDDVVLQKTPYVFDVSVWEILWATWYGAKIVLAKPGGHKDSSYLHKLIKKQGITTLHFVPGMLDAYNLYLVESKEKIGNRVRHIFCSGEALSRKTAEMAYNNAGNIQFRLHNLYGPTEVSIDVTYFETSPNGNVYIGKPIQNTRAYVLDSDFAPVPVGVTGELYLSGAGLARGYINRQDLTDERFIINPFATGNDKEKGYRRLYKTGDIVRWTPEGNLEYLGRNDNQVKIRGFRIELGEIESAMLQIKGIHQSCVLAKERVIEGSSARYLVGYYVAVEGEEMLTQETIITELSRVLPEYMIPVSLVRMESFPITINGKLDKKALPDSDLSQSTREYKPPVTGPEAAVCGIWQKILGLERVGITDDFFKIGGNSILAIQVSHRMSRIIGADVKVADIFKYKTISGILTLNSEISQSAIPRLAGSSSPLSFAQERLWFIEQYEQGTNAYHIPMVSELDKTTDKAGIKYALEQIVLRHEVLRSTIEQSASGVGIQHVHGEAPVIEELSISEKADYNSIIRADINRPFDLGKSYPVRVKFYNIVREDTLAVQESRTLLLINMHHIASDGWSGDIFQKELFAYYKAYISKDKDFRLPELGIQYKDYSAWQRSWLSGEILEKQLSYWKEKISGSQIITFPTDYVRPPHIDYKGSSQTFTISKGISEKLRVLARHHGVTLNSVLLSSVNILLGKYTGQEDIVTGSPIANRHHRQTEDLIGFFVNTQVNRTILNRNQNFHDLIKQVHQEQSEAQAYQDLPFEKLLDESGVERDPSRHPVFQIMFGLLNFGKASQVTDTSKMILHPYHLEEAFNVEKFDLSIFIDDSQEELCVQFSYATSLYHQDTILRIRNHYSHLLGQLAKAPEIPYSQIGLLNTEEYNRTVIEWNDTFKSYPDDKTIHELFAEQVFRTPVSIALVYEGQQLTYRELNEKSNQLARYIRGRYRQRTNQEMTPDTLIALYLNRSPELFAGILAVLKAGGAYVPIDTNYPQERIDFILEDTGAELILSQASLWKASNIRLPENRIVDISFSESLYNTEETSTLHQHSCSGDLAYVIYTSGTTGKPKGVMVNHSGIINRLVWMQAAYPLSDADVVLHKTPYVFDVSVWEIFWANWYGAKIVIAKPEGHKDSEYLHGLIREYQVTTVHFVPSMLEAYNHYLSETETGFSSSLRQIFCSGEALNKNTVEHAYTNAANESFRLHNLYGPTEASVDVTCFETAPGKNVYIGKPIQNTTVYVLDSFGNPVPIGIAGELYLGGAGIARGYLNRPELTLERFVTDPFVDDASRHNGFNRLYKTGDIVRWTPEGNLEYLGRNDNQVKIRGFRIELGEIESAMLQIKGIHQSCVLAKERVIEGSSARYLVGYYVAVEGEEMLTQETIITELSRVLPEYMIPVSLVRMESFPITINGKLDKKALPDSDLSQSTREYKPPVTGPEAAVCGIWQKILGLERVGITDDFFKIGGNSILAIQVSHRMSRIIGADVKVADIFKYKTISGILTLNSEISQSAIPRLAGSSSPLSFAQERLWFIEQYEQGTNAYHIPMVSELDKTTDKAGIKYALEQIVLRHEVLRSTIEQSASGVGIQHVHGEAPVIEELSISEKADYNSIIRADINRPFDLGKSYPVRVKFYNIVREDTLAVQESRTLLLINMHHIASDGWSGDIFQKELFAYYKAYISKDKDFRLPELGIQYKDYSAWQRSWLSGEILEKQLSYWKEKISGSQIITFPTDYVRPPHIDYKGSSQTFTISKGISEKLRVLARHHGVTLNSVLLSSVNILLGKYTGQEDIVTGSPIANRHHRQTEDLIGFFVNTQVNRTILNRNQNFHDLIKQVHQEQSEAQAYQDLPFEKLLDESGVERDPSRHPVFQIMFGLLNFGKASQVTDTSKMILHPYHLEEAFNVEKFDLSIFIDDSQEELCVQFSYATSLYHQDTILRIRNHYSHLLGQLAKAPEIPYSQIGLLNTEEYNRTVIEWNDTFKSYPDDKTIHELFAEQVFRTPVSIALVYEGQQLTYRELNEKSNQLARYIRGRYRQRTNQEMTPDTLIALYLNRSPELFAGILAVLKAGGAYVPIDTNYPQERIDFILEDTGAELILSQASLWKASNIRLPENRIVDISFSESLYNTEETSTLHQHSCSGDLAYVIYTSGTTGKPKGVMVNHSGIINRLVWMQAAYPLSDADVVLHKTPYVFDVSVWEIFWANWYGAKIVIAKPEGHKDSEYLHGLIREYQVTTVHFVPSMLEAYNHYLSETETGFSSSLRQIFCSGEALNKNTVEHAYTNAANESFRLHNLYGPTEASVDVTCFETAPGKNVYIGKPIQNTTVYVLDSFGNPVPIGIAGELYLGGAGIARGYLNRPELTLERFVTDPFVEDASRHNGFNRLYKTGDIVRWTPDGNLDYIGRNDNQVKIRGVRIELGEIEYALLQIPGIIHSCVLVKERKTDSGVSKYIAAYYVLGDEVSGPSEADIQFNLSTVLPEYMVPAVFIPIESMPLTINGKLDRSALPEPGIRQMQSEFQAPSGDVEILLSRIFQDVLGLECVGAGDDFFRIGGDSILSIQVSGRIRQAGFNIQVRDIFEYRTIRNIAVQLISRTSDSIIKTEQGVLTGTFGLLPVQQWFTEQVETGAMGAPDHWNQSFLIKVPVLDMLKLKLALDALMEYHDVLRIRFRRESSDLQDGLSWEQEYKPVMGACPFKMLDISEYVAEEVQHILTGWQSGFHLESGPLFQIGYLHGYKDGSARLFLALHHLIVDSVSWRILTEDIMMLYAGKELPSKGSSYRQWVTSVRNYALRNPAERTYWKGQIKNIPKEPLAGLREEPTAAFLEIDRDITKSLLQEASKAHQTEINDLLLTALAYALKDINGQDVQCIMLEGHGREDIDPAMDTSHTVGWFTTMFPVKLELQDSLKMSIEFIKESIRNIPSKGIGFGIFAAQSGSGFTFGDLPAISFNYLGQLDAAEGYWQILPGGSGNSSSPLNKDRNYININGMVQNGELMFSVVTRLGSEKTDRLAEALKENLIHIVSYCEEHYLLNGPGFTPSDFKDFIPYEIINGHLEEDPVFILPPGGGGAESYYDNIVPGLKNRKIVLFNNYFYYLRKKKINIDDYTIEHLSMYYRLLVRSLQPEGKYTILGWSFGGLLAFEIAMQLTKEGAEINKLILLDSFFSLRDADRYLPEEYVELTRKTLNYRYEKQFTSVGFEIVLFKARKEFHDIDVIADIEVSEKEIFKGYVKHYLETEYNGIDKLFVNGLNQVKDHIVVVDVETHHNNVPYAIAGDIINYV